MREANTYVYDHFSFEILAVKMSSLLEVHSICIWTFNGNTRLHPFKNHLL